MVCCDLGRCRGYLHVKDLFGISKLNYSNDFETALNSKFKPDSDMWRNPEKDKIDFSGANHDFAEKKWDVYFSGNAVIQRLNSCAAVLIYTYGNNKDETVLSAAHHAFGGEIESDFIELIDNGTVPVCKIKYVVFATPCLTEVKHDLHEKSVNQLADKCTIKNGDGSIKVDGTTKICLIEGFTQGSVVANKDGYIQFL